MSKVLKNTDFRDLLIAPCILQCLTIRLIAPCILQGLVSKSHKITVFDVLLPYETSCLLTKSVNLPEFEYFNERCQFNRGFIGSINGQKQSKSGLFCAPLANADFNVFSGPEMTPVATISEKHTFRHFRCR